MIEETTIQYPLGYRLRYRYYEQFHTCGIKVKPQNWTRRIKCSCSVRYRRVDRLWWRIIKKLI